MLSTPPYTVPFGANPNMFELFVFEAPTVYVREPTKFDEKPFKQMTRVFSDRTHSVPSEQSPAAPHAHVPNVLPLVVPYLQFV